MREFLSGVFATLFFFFFLSPAVLHELFPSRWKVGIDFVFPHLCSSSARHTCSAAPPLAVHVCPASWLALNLCVSGRNRITVLTSSPPVSLHNVVLCAKSSVESGPLRRSSGVATPAGEKKKHPCKNTSKQEVLQCVYSCGTVIRAHPMKSCAHLCGAPVNPARLPLRLKAVYSTCQPERRPRPAAAAQCAAKTNTDLFSLLGKMVINSVQASGAFCLLLLFQRLLFSTPSPRVLQLRQISDGIRRRKRWKVLVCVVSSTILRICAAEAATKCKRRIVGLFFACVSP